MNEISVISLILSSSLVFIAILLSYYQKLGMGKDIIIAAIRCVVQLVAVGYILQFIFDIRHPAVTTSLLLVIIFNATRNAAQRGEGIPRVFLLSFLSFVASCAIILSILILTQSISYAPDQVIPITGMIVGNSMSALGLTYRQMLKEFTEGKEQVEAKLALGADVSEASIHIVRSALKTALQPTIDSTKTVGLVALPGMMTGQILAGQDPIQAIKYQIMVMFMILASASIVTFTASFFAYRGFYNAKKQLRNS